MVKRIELVDFLRGFSIFGVVIVHLLQKDFMPGIVTKAMAFATAGVHLFILCSGFGLYLSHLRKPLTYTDFLRKRFTKIYIPYIIVILVSALLPLCVMPHKWMAVASHLLLFKMFVEELNTSFGQQMWFVSTIFQFYLFWPLIVRFFHKMRHRELLCALAVSLVWATLVALLGRDSERVWNSFFLQYFWEFVLGMYLAKAYVERPDRMVMPRMRTLVIVCLVSVTLHAAMGLSGGVWKLYNDVPSVTGFAALLLILYKLRTSHKWFACATRFFIFSNKFSYELYLVHILIYAICDYIALRLGIHLAINLLFSLTAAYFGAYLYHLLLIRLHLKRG